MMGKPVKLYDSLPEKQNVVLDLPLFEGTGSLVRDLSRYHNNGSLIGGVTWNQLLTGKNCLAFNGVNGGVQIANSPSINGITATLAAMAWIYPTDLSGERCILSLLNDSGAINRRSWMLITTAGPPPKLRFYCSPDGTHGSAQSLTGATTLTINTWWHVMVLYLATYWALLINGEIDASGDPIVNSLYQNVVDPLCIGQVANPGRNFAGWITLPRAMNGVLSVPENVFRKERNMIGV